MFLDVAQAFDKIWHKGLIHKITKYFPKQSTEILESYLAERLFRVKYGNEYSELREIKAGMPQSTVLGLILYFLYTSNIPHFENVTVATFAPF